MEIVSNLRPIVFGPKIRTHRPSTLTFVRTFSQFTSSAAKEELLAELAARIKEEGEEPPPDEGDPSFLDEPWVAEFNTWLGEQAEFDKQQFIKQRGRRGRRRVS